MPHPLPSPVAPRDREILRPLAARVREIAELPEMASRRRRLVEHNALNGDRPVVVCSPEGAWEEILPLTTMECESAFLRDWERTLRMKIYMWDHIRDDGVWEPFFSIPWSIESSDHGIAIPFEHGANRGSFVWAAPFESIADCLAKLQPATHRVDRERTAAELALADALFGDLLPARLAYRPWWGSGYTLKITHYIGLETLLLAPYDQPDELKALIAWFGEEHVRYLRWLEAEGVLTDTSLDGYVGSGGYPHTRELPQPGHEPGSPIRLIDRWGFAEAQETVGMSPEMFAEFILPTQQKQLALFGLNSYGCCEPVHERIDDILTIPHLRRVSVSAWCDEAVMAEKLGSSVIYSRKPNPTQICLVFDEAKIRQDLQTTLNLAGQGSLEFVMKDTHTVQNEPWRLSRWVEIALDEVRRYAEQKR